MSVPYTQINPAQLSDRINELENNIFAVNPIVDQICIGGRLHMFPLATPATPTLVTVGGAAATQTYLVVAYLGTGQSTPSATVSTTSGPTTLSATAFNTVTFTPVAGATSYGLFRTVGGASQGKIATVNATGAASYSVADTGLVGDTTVASQFNTSALISAGHQSPPTIMAASGPITRIGNQALITLASLAALTLGLPTPGGPSVGGHDGVSLDIISTTPYAHTVTTPASGYVGGFHVFTFSTTVNTALSLIASNGIWYVKSLGGGALS